MPRDLRDLPKNCSGWAFSVLRIQICAYDLLEITVVLNQPRSFYPVPLRRQQSMASGNPAHTAWNVQVQEGEADFISPLYFKEFWLRDGT